MRSITAITLFLFTVLGATASHATSFTWTTLDHPNGVDTDIYGIDGANMVGSYTDSSGGIHGFRYDGSSWTTLDHPSATDTWLAGIDGDNIVGSYEDSSGVNHGLLYDGSTWTTLDYPGMTYTDVYDIDGANMVGSYEDSSGNWHGFKVTLNSVPEPAALLLALFGLALLPRRRGR